MISMFAEALSLPFFVKALIVGSLVSLCSALLGVSLVLKRYSMIGDGLSHVGFGALAIAVAVGATNAPLLISIPVVTIAAFFLLRISESSKIKGDSAIAIISTASLAIGVLIISITSGMNTDVCNYMFGSILVLSKEDVIVSIILSVIVIALYVIFYSKIFAVTFDEGFAKATGTKAGMYNTLIAILTAITIVIGMRLMGSLLISSLIVFPALTSMRIFKNFKSVTICSAIVSVVCFLTGIFLSYILDTAVGALVVCVNLAMFIIFWIIGTIIKRAKV